VKKVRLAEAKPYNPPKHFNMTAFRLHGKDETGTQKFWVGLSHFLPGGGAQYDATPTEKVYFVLEGEISVKTAPRPPFEATLALEMPVERALESVNRWISRALPAMSPMVGLSCARAIFMAGR